MINDICMIDNHIPPPDQIIAVKNKKNYPVHLVNSILKHNQWDTQLLSPDTTSFELFIIFI